MLKLAEALPAGEAVRQIYCLLLQPQVPRELDQNLLKTLAEACKTTSDQVASGKSTAPISEAVLLALCVMAASDTLAQNQKLETLRTLSNVVSSEWRKRSTYGLLQLYLAVLSDEDPSASADFAEAEVVSEALNKSGVFQGLFYELLERLEGINRTLGDVGEAVRLQVSRFLARLFDTYAFPVTTALSKNPKALDGLMRLFARLAVSPNAIANLRATDKFQRIILHMDSQSSLQNPAAFCKFADLLACFCRAGDAAQVFMYDYLAPNTTNGPSVCNLSMGRIEEVLRLSCETFSPQTHSYKREEIQILLSLLDVLGALANNPDVQARLLRKFPSMLNVLFRLLRCGLPTVVGGRIFVTIAQFAVREESATTIWARLSENQYLYSSVQQRLNPQDVRAILRDYEAPTGAYPLTKGFLNVVESLLGREPWPVTLTEQDINLYIEYVRDVFLNLTKCKWANIEGWTSSFANVEERTDFWPISESCFKIFSSLLTRVARKQSHGRRTPRPSKIPAWFINHVYDPNIGILKMTTDIVAKASDHLQSRPTRAIKSALREALVFLDLVFGSQAELAATSKLASSRYSFKNGAFGGLSPNMLLKICGAIPLLPDVTVRLLAKLIDQHGKQVLLALKRSDEEELRRLSERLANIINDSTATLGTQANQAHADKAQGVIELLLLDDGVTGELTENTSILESLLQLVAKLADAPLETPKLTECAIRLLFQLLSGKKAVVPPDVSYFTSLYLNVTDDLLSSAKELSLVELNILRWLLKCYAQILHLPTPPDERPTVHENSSGQWKRLLNIFHLLERSAKERVVQDWPLGGEEDMKEAEPALNSPEPHRALRDRRPPTKPNPLPEVYQAWSEVVFLTSAATPKHENGVVVLLNEILLYACKEPTEDEGRIVTRAGARLVKTAEFESTQDKKVLLQNLLSACVRSPVGTRVWLYHMLLDLIRRSTSDEYLLFKNTFGNPSLNLAFWRVIAADATAHIGSSAVLTDVMLTANLSLHILEMIFPLAGGPRVIHDLALLPNLYDAILSLVPRLGRRTVDWNRQVLRFLAIVGFLTKLVSTPHGVQIVCDELDFLDVLSRLTFPPTEYKLHTAVYQFFATACRVAPNNTFVHGKALHLLGNMPPFVQSVTSRDSKNVQPVHVDAALAALLLLSTCSARNKSVPREVASLTKFLSAEKIKQQSGEKELASFFSRLQDLNS